MVRMHLKPSRQKLTASKSLFTFSSIVSLGTLLFYNVPFFSYVAQNTDEPTGGKLFLLASLVVIMLVLNFMMTYLVMWLLRVVGRVLLAVLAVINATALHFILTYGVIIDATTIENVFNTRYSEASGFFSWSLWLCILGLGVLPALYCLWQPVVYGKAKKLAVCCGSSLAVVLVIALMHIGQTLWISQHDTELGGLLQPWSYLVNTCRVLVSTTNRSKRSSWPTVRSLTMKKRWWCSSLASQPGKPTSSSTAISATPIRCYRNRKG